MISAFKLPNTLHRCLKKAHISQLSLRLNSNIKRPVNESESKNTSESNPVVSMKKDILQKTPLGKLDEFQGKHPYEEKEPLPAFEGGVNPETGEIGGPRGPEPTRYGDWERKGRVSDF